MIIPLLLVFSIIGHIILGNGIGYCSNSDITTKSECTGSYEWIVPFNNYDNIGSSMITFFEISTLEKWPDMMFNA